MGQKRAKRGPNLRRIGALWTYLTYTIGHFCNKTAHSKGFG